MQDNNLLEIKTVKKLLSTFIFMLRTSKSILLLFWTRCILFTLMIIKSLSYPHHLTCRCLAHVVLMVSTNGVRY